MMIAAYLLVALLVIGYAMFATTKGHKGCWVFQRVFGLWIAVGQWFGNCFAPAVVLTWLGRSRPVTLRSGEVSRPAWATLTLRSRSHRETIIYWRGGLRLDWNSEHIAIWLGTWHDGAMDGSTPDCSTYKGWLGDHMYV